MSNGYNTTTQYLLMCGSTALAMPSSYKTVTQEINSQRSQRSAASGKMVKIRIATKKQITVEWNVLTKAEKNTIINATSGTSFSVKYFDVETDTFKTSTFYRGSDFEIEPLIRYKGTVVGTASEFVAYRVKMTLTEM